MSEKKTEVKVSINCQKCKSGVLKTVAKLTGVNEVKLDGEKGILSVVGSIDPVCVAVALRKAGYYAEITSVGPPKKPDENPKSPEKAKPPLPPCCKQCQLVAVSFVSYDSFGTHRICSIL